MFIHTGHWSRPVSQSCFPISTSSDHTLGKLVIGVGTGFGCCSLVFDEGAYVSSPTEAGHA